MRYRLACVAGLLALAAGCRPGAAADAAEDRLGVLSRLYLHAAHAAGSDGTPRGVNDPDHLRAVLDQMDDEQFEAFGVRPGDLNRLFVSPRDGQPFQIVYRVRPAPPTRSDPAVIIAEASGLDGRRLVAYTDGRVEEVDADRVEVLIRKARGRGVTP